MIKIAAILITVAAAITMFGAAADSMQTVMHVTVGMRG